MTDPPPRPVMCPRCDKPMHAALVKTAIWRDERVFLIENIPAQVCDSCMDQYYDEDVADALRRLAEDGFPSAEIKREVLVPVFSLEKRIKRPSPDSAPIYWY